MSEAKISPGVIVFVTPVGFECFYRLFKQGLRLAVISAVILWNCTGTLVKWGVRCGGGEIFYSSTIRSQSFSVSKLAISQLSWLEETGIGFFHFFRLFRLW